MKRFVTQLNDAETPFWQVWGQEKISVDIGFGNTKLSKRLTYRYAEFYGDGARKYAVAHARMLNALPKEKQPRRTSLL